MMLNPNTYHFLMGKTLVFMMWLNILSFNQPIYFSSQFVKVLTLLRSPESKNGNSTEYFLDMFRGPEKKLSKLLLCCLPVFSPPVVALMILCLRKVNVVPQPTTSHPLVWMLIKKSHNGFPIRLIVMCGFLWPSSKLGV